jgi:hypothetical protein
MGDFPPIDGPYKEMMVVTNKTYEQALNNQNYPVYDEQEDHISPDKIDWDNIQVKMGTNQTKQFVTMYENLMEFDERKECVTPCKSRIYGVSHMNLLK